MKPLLLSREERLSRLTKTTYYQEYKELLDTVAVRAQQRWDGKEDYDFTIDAAARKRMRRWSMQSVGNSPAAWSERSVLFSALMLDHRSRLLDKINENPPNWLTDQIQHIPPQRHPQAVQALAFQFVWQRYLHELMFVMPRDLTRMPKGLPYDPTLPWYFVDQVHRDTHPENVRLLFRLGHCLPAGAFFDLAVPPELDEWHNNGERHICGRSQLCPSCHARSAVRLLQRIQAGPCRAGRRAGRQLFMAKTSIPSGVLPLEADKLEVDYSHYQRLYRFIDPTEYLATTPEEDFMNRIQGQQEISNTLTRHEYDVAHQAAMQLTDWCKDLGLEGGLQIHQIGPHGRRFAHEIAVVGEIKANSTCDRFGNATGITGEKDAALTIAGQKIACVLMPPNYQDAARILLAGTSWKFDLEKVGAKVNGPAKEMTRNGLRGALAWQPLFLLNGTSFFSRALVLNSHSYRQKRSTAFGTWRDELPSDREYRSPTQQRRWEARGGQLKDGVNRDPIVRLDRWRKDLKVSKAALARAVKCSSSAISRLFNEKHGSKQLVEHVKRALEEISRNLRQPVMLTTPQKVRGWMKYMRITQAQLAHEIGWTRGRVSHQLNKKTRWSSAFQDAVNHFAAQWMKQQADLEQPDTLPSDTWRSDLENDVEATNVAELAVLVNGNGAYHQRGELLLLLIVAPPFRRIAPQAIWRPEDFSEHQPRIDRAPSFQVSAASDYHRNRPRIRLALRPMEHRRLTKEAEALSPPGSPCVGQRAPAQSCLSVVPVLPLKSRRSHTVREKNQHHVPRCPWNAPYKASRFTDQ